MRQLFAFHYRRANTANVTEVSACPVVSFFFHGQRDGSAGEPFARYLVATWLDEDGRSASFASIVQKPAPQPQNVKLHYHVNKW